MRFRLASALLLFWNEMSGLQHSQHDARTCSPTCWQLVLVAWPRNSKEKLRNPVAFPLAQRPKDPPTTGLWGQCPVVFPLPWAFAVSLGLRFLEPPHPPVGFAKKHKQPFLGALCFRTHPCLEARTSHSHGCNQLTLALLFLHGSHGLRGNGHRLCLRVSQCWVICLALELTLKLSTLN